MGMHRINSLRQSWRSRYRECRLSELANGIATILNSRGIDACPADCSEGICCVVVFHGDSPDDDARDLVDNGDGLEETLLYEGRQILHARRGLRDINESDDASNVLALFRTVQDRDTWL